MTTGTFEGLRTASVNGAALAYCEPVVFVMVGASDLRTREQQVPAMGANYRPVAHSRRYSRPNDDIEAGADDQMLPHVEERLLFYGRLRVLQAPA